MGVVTERVSECVCVCACVPVCACVCVCTQENKYCCSGNSAKRTAVSGADGRAEGRF